MQLIATCLKDAGFTLLESSRTSLSATRHVSWQEPRQRVCIELTNSDSGGVIDIRIRSQWWTLFLHDDPIVVLPLSQSADLIQREISARLGDGELIPLCAECEYPQYSVTTHCIECGACATPADVSRSRLLTRAALAAVAVLTFGVWAVAWLLNVLGLSDIVPWLYPTRVFPNVWVLAGFFLFVAIIGRARLRKRFETI